MVSNWAYGVATLVAALVAACERFGSAPIAAVQGTSAPFAVMPTPATRTHARLTGHQVARKANDRVPPRGRL